MRVRIVVTPGVGLALQPVGERGKLGRLAEHIFCRQHPELDLVDRQQILDSSTLATESSISP